MKDKSISSNSYCFFQEKLFCFDVFSKQDKTKQNPLKHKHSWLHIHFQVSCGLDQYIDFHLSGKENLLFWQGHQSVQPLNMLITIIKAIGKTQF